jgi:DNA-binding CsgD family transcriptional regulator
VAVALAVLATVGTLLIPPLVPWAHGAVFVFLFYAGIRGILTLRYTSTLLPSSRTAATVATISFVMYPVIVCGDLAGWNLGFLDPRVSFWMQAHPLYISVIMVPVGSYIYHNQQRAPSHSAGTATARSPTKTPHAAHVSDATRTRLTRRENEILLLLYQGYRYREIAEQLYVSLATVRTHVHHIYEKLDISRKEELFVAMRSTDGPEPAARQ